MPPGTKPFCCSTSSPETVNPSNNQTVGNSACSLLQVLDKHVESYQHRFLQSGLPVYFTAYLNIDGKGSSQKHFGNPNRTTTTYPNNS